MSIVNSRLRLSVPVALAAAGVLLAGCGSSGPAQQTASPAASRTAGGSAPSTPAATSSAATSSAATSSAATSNAGAGTGAASIPACTAAQLEIQYTDNSQIKQGALNGMSHADTVVMFTNQGSASCQTGGYPGVAALDSAGKQIMQAVRSSGTGKVITLAPGATASALVSADTASCTSLTPVAGLLVTAPNERTSTRLGSAGKFCLNSLQVGTLQPGNAAGLSV
jgi:hypothetical protein